MNKVLPLLLIILLSSVSATTINAPKEIPPNINWSFSIELNPTDSFTKTEIYFDNALILTAFNDKEPLIQQDLVLKAFIFDKKPEDNTGMTVYVSFFGIEEGKHLIETKTFNKETLVEEKEFEVNSGTVSEQQTTAEQETAKGQEKKDDNGTGFYNFYVQNAWIGLIFLLLLLAVLLAFQLRGKREEKIVFRDALEEKERDEKREEKKKKLAIKEAEIQEDERTGTTRFGMSDLLKK